MLDEKVLFGGAKMPLYDQILDAIMKDIKTGRLKEGDKLPTEMELSKEFGVSRPTVRNALLRLANQGYLVRVRGNGTFVTKPKLEQESVQFIESYNQEMKAKGLVPKTQVLEFRVIPCDDRIASKLDIRPDDKVIRLTRLRYATPYYEEQPVLLTTVYLPYNEASAILSCDLENTSLYETLERQGITICKAERELEIKLVYGKAAKLLEVPKGSPAHFISSVGYDQSGKPMEYSESFYPAGRNKFIIRINR